jgi:hypothetical protein
MKPSFLIAALWAIIPLAVAAENPGPEELLAQHREGSAKVANEQDELSADVQQLVIEQTAPKVIELLGEVENIMDEATDLLAESDTGGDTIAAQTEIIEKIHAAAKEKQSQGKGGGKPGSAMMDMMERMMGKKPGEGEGKEGKGKGGDKGGTGQTGLSDTANEATGGQGGGNSQIRRVPKAAGAATLALPEEFRKAFDAYNRGAEKMVK